MERFKYRKSLVRLTVDNIITTHGNSRVDLYLRIRRVESLFPPDCLIIARLGFSKERIGHGTYFTRFLTDVAQKYGFNHIDIEYANAKSNAFAKKLGFYSIDGENYAIAYAHKNTNYAIEYVTISWIVSFYLYLCKLGVLCSMLLF